MNYSILQRATSEKYEVRFFLHYFVSNSNIMNYGHLKLFSA